MYLNTHSYFSLRYGTFSVKEVVAKAKSLNVEAMALTDINNSSGICAITSLIRSASIARDENNERKMKIMAIRDKDQVITDLKFILNSCLNIFISSPIHNNA